MLSFLLFSYSLPSSSRLAFLRSPVIFTSPRVCVINGDLAVSRRDARNVKGFRRTRERHDREFKHALSK